MLIDNVNFDYCVITYLCIKVKGSLRALKSTTCYVEVKREGHYHVVMNDDTDDGDIRSKCIVEHLSTRRCVYSGNEWKIHDARRIQLYTSFVRGVQYGQLMFDAESRPESSSNLVGPLFVWDDVISITETKGVIET